MRIDAQTLGQRVADARQRAGLTQAQTASEAHLDRSALAKIELGDRRVTALELSRIAEAVGERIEWFLQDTPAAIASHRNVLDPGQASPQIDHEIERRAREVEFVVAADARFDLAEIEAQPLPSDAAEVESLASHARSVLGVDQSGPICTLDQHVVHAGLLPFVVDLGPDSADAASVLLRRGAVVVVNGALKVGRRRLALAHELGHVLVADDYTVDYRVATEDSIARREGRFDRFARALLLPQSSTASAWSAYLEQPDGNLRTAAVRVASEYRVDMATLARRLLELDLIGPDDATVVRSARTTRADIVDFDLVVGEELLVGHLPQSYIAAVLRLYRAEWISPERALELLFDTWESDELPPLPQRSADEIWQYV